MGKGMSTNIEYKYYTIPEEIFDLLRHRKAEKRDALFISIKIMVIGQSCKIIRKILKNSGTEFLVKILHCN